VLEAVLQRHRKKYRTRGERWTHRQRRRVRTFNYPRQLGRQLDAGDVHHAGSCVELGCLKNSRIIVLRVQRVRFVVVAARTTDERPG
jgi:hypothetical protein